MTQKDTSKISKKMHEMYMSGATMYAVAAHFKVSQSTVVRRFQKYNYETKRAVKKTIKFNGKRYTFTQGYYRSTDAKRTKLHRDIYIAFKGKIPEGSKVYFIDGNSRNYQIENLILLKSRKSGLNDSDIRPALPAPPSPPQRKPESIQGPEDTE